MNRSVKFFFGLVWLLIGSPIFAQYILNGSAQQNSCNCYTLTPAEQTKSGSVWNRTKINLTSSFDFWFKVNLGCSDGGADGIVFMLQPISTSVGTTGEGMGFGGVSPSIGIALDTWQNANLNDPPEDHISIQANGVVNHASDLAGPVAISATSANVEDCKWHRLRITWDVGTKWLRAYFDGVVRVEKQLDLVGTIFGNDPLVYWGFTGATGGAVNLQQFCTALDPVFASNFTNNITCEDSPVTFTNASESFAPIVSYYWSFGDGTFSTAENPPPHTYTIAGDYEVKLKITGQDGCEKDSSKTIKVAPLPTASLQAFDTCQNKAVRLQLAAPSSGVTMLWTLDGTAGLGSQQPVFDNLAAGVHQLKVEVSSIYGCGNPAVADVSFLVKPAPVVQALFADACTGEDVVFRGDQLDANTTISEWNWRFESQAGNGQTITHRFSTKGSYPVQLTADATNGCSSEIYRATININSAQLVASDTAIIANTAAQLQVFSNGTVLWQPGTGLSNAAITNPIATLSAGQQYTITATTAEGCTTEKTILVKVFKGPAVYVPTAFTPNGDNKNDWLLPVYAGINELKEFAVFNRWGQALFRTNNMLKGWDGRKAIAGTYVWLIRVVDYLGKPITVKGTVTIIR